MKTPTDTQKGTQMFRSDSNRYQGNLLQAAGTTAHPAELQDPAGPKVPAVVIRDTRYILGILPIAEALRVAHEIADAVAAHKAGGDANGKAEA
jgi:hypothetical protein